ncbi:MAG: sigma-70 family RNA polymerase sigma factor [Bacteroidales bacterium]|nr:sigma-70 family RNA polymerase sigma factor [Bacteroidales bacterium]
MTVNGHNEDERAFRELVRRQRDLIWQVCRSYRFSAAWEPQDAFHEVLMVLWHDYSTFDGRSSERTWVYRVAVNTLVSLKRRIGNQPTVDAPAMPDPSTDPDGDERRHYLRQLIDTLDERDHSIVMAHLHGFSNIEIARMTGLTAAHVSVLLTRIKRKLRKLYEDEI